MKLDIDVAFLPQSKDEIIEIINGCACCTLTSSSHGAPHLEKSCRLEDEDCVGRGKDRQRDSSLTKTSFNVDGGSASPNGHSEWLARGGMKTLTSIIAEFKP